MNIRECEKCGAKWLNGTLFWATGKSGLEEDLAGLVCNALTDNEDIKLCINQKRGDTSGSTWEYRRGYVDGMMAELGRPKDSGFGNNWSI